MKKLEQLTAEQIALLPLQRDKWLKIGLSTDPLDFEAAKKAAIEAYKVAGLSEPKFFFRFQSPLSAAIGAAILKNDKLIPSESGAQVGAQVWYQVRAQVWDQVRAQARDQVGAQVRDQVWAQVWAQVGDQVRAQVGDQVWDQVRAQVWAQVRGQVGTQIGDHVWAQVYGCHDAEWLGFYDTFFIFGVDGESKLKPLIDLAKVCGWWAPYSDAVIFQDRPERIKFDDRNLLHCEDGPAILYRDGFAVYSWHGVRIPGEWIENKPTAKEALTWDNMEQRRAACEIVGWANILKELNAETIQKDPDPEIGELLEVDIPGVGREKFLRVMCGTGREFALPVPPEMRTALEANAWTWGLQSVDYAPEVRT